MKRALVFVLFVALVLTNVGRALAVDIDPTSPEAAAARRAEAAAAAAESRFDDAAKECDPAPIKPSHKAVDDAAAKLPALQQAATAARAATKGPADADKSAAYKKLEQQLADAQARKAAAVAKIDAWAAKAKVSKANGDPAPYPPSKAIDDYDKAAKDEADAQRAIDRSPEMKAFKKNLPDLERAAHKAEVAYDRAIRDYINALDDYERALDKALRDAGFCPKGADDGLPLPTVPTPAAEATTTPDATEIAVEPTVVDDTTGSTDEPSVDATVEVDPAPAMSNADAPTPDVTTNGDTGEATPAPCTGNGDADLPACAADGGDPTPAACVDETTADEPICPPADGETPVAMG